MECRREAIRPENGLYELEVAKGTRLRHDHGSQFVSHAFNDELRRVRIESSPSFVRQSEDNGCVESFIRTLKERLLRLRRFGTIAELDRALRDFVHRLNDLTGSLSSVHPL